MGSRPNRLTIVQHNVLSWGGSRRLQLANMYLEINPDIILINAHGRSNEQRMKIFPYDIYQRNDQISGEPQNDGVAIAVKRNLRYRILDDFVDEVMAVTVETSQGLVTVATCYLPPRRPYVPMFDFHRLASLPHPCYMIGDVNARHRLFGYRTTNNVGEQIAELIHDNYWTHLGPNFKTFFGAGRVGTPDIVLANRHCFLNHHISPGPKKAGSDHIPVQVLLSTNPIMVPAPKHYVYKEADWEMFSRTLMEGLALPELDGRPHAAIDDAVDTLYDAILQAKEVAIPKRALRTKPHPKRSAELTRLEHQLRDLREEEAINGWSMDKYRRQMSIIRQILMETKRLHQEHWDSLLTEITNNHADAKVFWGKVKRLQGNERGSKFDHMKDSLGNEHYNDEGKEYVFREYWSKVFDISPDENMAFDREFENLTVDYVEEHGNELWPHDDIDLSRLQDDNEYSCKFINDDIKRVIKSFKNGKAPGLSGINKADLEHLPAVAITYLTLLFNASLSTGYFPAKFKKAKLVFVPKSGKDPRQPSSYRPISLLEVPGKCLEKLINERMVNYAEENGIQDPNQYGFRPRRGCTRAIALGYELAATQVAMGGAVTIITRDIEKAFDKVWPDGVRARLIEAGVPNALARLSSSFLEDRTAQIRINGTLGPPMELNFGVPQGSCLSPTLFIINTADTPQPNENNGTTHIAYADDHTQFVLTAFNAPVVHAARTSRAIRERNRYERKKKIKNNMGKMALVTPRKRKPAEVFVDGRELRIDQKIKFLGFVLSNYGFRDHIAIAKAKASRNFKKLKRFSNLPAKLKLRLYKAMILPILDYPPVPCHAASRSAIQSLQTIQNRALYWVHCRENQAEDRRPFVRDLHYRHRLEPINVRLHRLAGRVWEKISAEEDPILNQILLREEVLQQGGGRRGGVEHTWFPRSRPRAMGPPPIPIFTFRDITELRRRNL